MPEPDKVDREFFDECVYPNLGGAHEGKGGYVDGDDVEHSDADHDRAAVEESLERVGGEQ